MRTHARSCKDIFSKGVAAGSKARLAVSHALQSLIEDNTDYCTSLVAIKDDLVLGCVGLMVPL